MTTPEITPVGGPVDTFTADSTTNGITLWQRDAEGDRMPGRRVDLTPDDALGLLHRLASEIRTFHYPEMIVRLATEEDVENGDADAADEGRVVMECPRCGHVAAEDGEDAVNVIDVDFRYTGGQIMGGCTVTTPELWVPYDSETNYELLVIQCAGCDDPVSLPKNVTEHN